MPCKMFFVVNRHATPARESASLVEIPGRLSWQAFVPGFRAGFLPALENPAVPTQAFAVFHETDSDPAVMTRAFAEYLLIKDHPARKWIYLLIQRHQTALPRKFF